MKSHGAGLSSVRFICGTQDIHKKLEQQIAEFHEREDTILYASCFDANAGLFEQICGPEVHFTIWGSSNKTNLRMSSCLTSSTTPQSLMESDSQSQESTGCKCYCKNLPI